jgi:hypothetical protein
MTRVMHIWLFQRTVGPIQEGDTCHHWKGDTWHMMTSASYVARVNHLFAQPEVLCHHVPRVPRRLGAGGALTVLRFAPLARNRSVPGYNAHWERVPGSCTQRCDL